jgi:hypothetical protein
MRHATAILLITLLAVIRLDAARITPFIDVDAFIQNASQIVIADCISTELPPKVITSGGPYAARAKTVKILKGKAIPSDFRVHTATPLAAYTRYMFCFYDDRQSPDFWAYDDLCVVPIKSIYLPTIEKDDLRTQILFIFQCRISNIEEEQKSLANEKVLLEKALK